MFGSAFQMKVAIATVLLVQLCQSFTLNGRLPIPLNEFPSASRDSFTWRMHDGSYRFGMQGQDQWRVERRSPDGGVYFRYAYRAPNGQIIENRFTSGNPFAPPPRQDEEVEEAVGIEPPSEQEQFQTSDSALDEPSPNYTSDVTEYDPPPKPRMASPYGALKILNQGGDFVDTNSIVDEQTKSLVFILN